MMIKAVLTGALAGMMLFPGNVKAQGDSSVYRLNAWADGTVLLGAGVMSYLGSQRISSQEALDLEMVSGLSQGSVSGIDRMAFQMDMGVRQRAQATSDMFLHLSMVAPALLGLDRRVRQEWKPVLGMYMEAMLVNCSVQSWTANIAGRYRPITYVPGADWDLRTDATNQNSFFSGHTSTVATASFFMAKVMDDMHPELGGKRWLLYSAAAIPTIMTGYYRVQAGKHFPTDVLTGAAFGALVGVLVPELHKRRLPGGLSVVPFTSDQATGVQLALQW